MKTSRAGRQSWRATGAAAALVMASGLAWPAVLAVTPGTHTATASAVLGVCYLLLSTIAAVGLLVARALWARRLGYLLAAAGLLLGLVLPIGLIWWCALGFCTAAGILLMGPLLGGQVRTRPLIGGPPTEAVVLPLLQVASPGLVAAFSTAKGTDANLLALTGLSFVCAFWFSRTLSGALWAARLVYPVGTLTLAVLAFPRDLPAAIVTTILGTVAALIAFRPATARSVRQTRGRPVAFPPELAPPEVLDAAGIDDDGRPQPSEPA